jgi:aminopeptidase N
VTRTAAALVLALAAQAVVAAAPHLDLNVQLDPATGLFSAQAELVLASEQAVRLKLPALDIQSARLDDAPLPTATENDTWTWTPGTQAAGKALRIAWRGRIAAMDETLSHRDVLDALPPMVSAAGSYLPAGSGWYPDPGAPFTYRLEVTTPDGEIAVAPGAPHERSAMPGKRATVFEHRHPVDGIELMTGPYAVTERRIAIDGRAVRVRTYFHEDLQPLAADYLDSAVAYLQRYSREIGAYPFHDFSIVSAPLPTGFGMPTLTYLGRQVLKLPFIRHTSLGHEVLHNWWGNGVRVDVSRGNWAEGLTTFMADYAYKEDAGAAAAREMRHGWLRDFAALPDGADRPLSAFRARHHTASSVVGYGKSAMLFLALREQLGERNFRRGLRQFWQAQQFRAASFDDLRRAFEQASGRKLDAFFDQWLERSGAPAPAVAGAAARDDEIEVVVTQDLDSYRARVPLRLDGPDGTRTDIVEMDARERRFPIPRDGGVRSVTLDPEFRVWRRLAVSEAPPVLRDAVAAERLDVLALAGASEAGAMQLAQSFAEGRVQRAAPGADGRAAPLLIAGTRAAIDAWLAANGLGMRPALLAAGDTQAWIAPLPDRRVVLVSLPEDGAEAALAALSRRLPHMASHAWLAFDGERIAGRGNWPAQSPAVEVRR